MRLPALALGMLSALLVQLPAEPPALAQRKPHDIGNCFTGVGCRGDSIGRMWVEAPEFCAILGGRSWMNEALVCRNLHESRAYAAEPPPPEPSRRSGSRPARPGR